MKWKATLLLLALVPPTTARAAKPETAATPSLSAAPAVAPDAVSEDDYFSVLKSLRPGDLESLGTIDFARFRRGYFEATKGSRLPALDSDIERKLGVAFGQRRWDDVVALADTILNANYTRIRAHMLKGYALQQRGQDGSFHFAVGRRLLESILATGDGRSFDTAFHVFFVEEEYDLLKSQQLQFTGQSLTENKKRSFDVITARNAEGASVTVYFDVTEHMQRLGDLLK